MNQLKFIIASVLLMAVATSASAAGVVSAQIVPMESQQVIMPNANTVVNTGTMTLEQLLLWIQQYNLAHPENPIVLDMNTILSAPPQQIKTIIETHINTETHHSGGGGGDNHDDHDHHHKFNWNDLFHGGHRGEHYHPTNTESGVRSPHDSLDDIIIHGGHFGDNNGQSSSSSSHSPSDDDAVMDHQSDNPQPGNDDGSSSDSSDSGSSSNDDSGSGDSDSSSGDSGSSDSGSSGGDSGDGGGSSDSGGSSDGGGGKDSSG